ncbi:MAG: tetratricopeptide repeat protein [Reichenbachiella sp.]
MSFRYLHIFLLCVLLQSCLKIDSTDVHEEETVVMIQEPGTTEEKVDKSYYSLLGDTLETPPLSDRVRSFRERQLEKVRSEYDANPDSLENIVWYGRRLAYLYYYKEAIEVFTKGLDLHPESYKLYRHRGHRYLTTRQIDLAIEDLEKAAFYVRGEKVVMETDGLPNKRNIPRSSIHFNIWYHLGLAYYLNSNYDKAVSAYRKCIELADNHDMLVSSSNWLYMTYRKLGNRESAEELLFPIKRNMNIVENFPYYNLLLMYKGKKTAKDLIDINNIDETIAHMTVAYGVGNLYYLNGQTDLAIKVFDNMMKSPYWQSFGYLAAEVELANRKVNKGLID